jgi:PPOX class probable F420-dependent enzyme
VAAVVDIALPAGAFYLLRLCGVDAYLSLVLGAAIPVAAVLVRFAWWREVDRLGVYVAAIMLLGLGISVWSASPRALLAREAWLTGFTGLWFLVSVWSRRPLAFLYSRPLLERRTAPAGTDWDELWERVPRFRRLWRAGTALWGVALLADAAVRVAMAYTLPVDVVPALGTALYGATSVVLIGITNVYYFRSGLYDRRSALYATASVSAGGPRPRPTLDDGRDLLVAALPCPGDLASALRDETYVALTTFRADTTAVTTPVWAAVTGDRLLMYTPERSGKARRVRRDPEVRIAPCDFDGTPHGPGLTGRARVLPRAELARVREALGAKYGLRFRWFTLILLLGRPRRYGGRAVGLEVLLTGPAPDRLRP